jgi:hypothetical protein
MSLTPNAIQRMFSMSGSVDSPSFLPAVQVLHLKKIEQTNGADDRWKVSWYLLLSLLFMPVEQPSNVLSMLYLYM